MLVTTKGQLFFFYHLNFIKFASRFVKSVVGAVSIEEISFYMF
ncbi:hypothetical protein HMPREF0663_11950 [Hoylesella oralis ATCC 33269]|uniref:Uncharacterized protein n=1 Tax=Hoylesella oralis ATCC 33269 TaxID=873533 RepID=E7RT77_9BACT|nr:hypothetical protein HMPREF0663_11950 [Hoylesella oralis ATCC 33269]